MGLTPLALRSVSEGILAWKIPWMEKSSQKSLHLFHAPITALTSLGLSLQVFLSPQASSAGVAIAPVSVGYSPWGREESDTTEVI